MMFQFNFKVDENDVGKEKTDSESKPSKMKAWLEAQPHQITKKHLEGLSDENTVEEVTIGQNELKYLSMAPTLEKLKDTEISSNIQPVFKDDTDLVPAVYEGGLKIWECTWDLLDYMSYNVEDLKGCRVLELGCGCGLLAINLMLRGAHISLQDYNEEVIRHITIPNVLLNAVDVNILEEGDPETFEKTIEEVTARSSFYSGDWGSLDKLLANETQISCKDDKFDLIVTSETIYNQECHEKLLSLMTNHLKKSGKILLAAKSYYFGVGGGILQFCELIKKWNQLEAKTVFTDEIGVKREILEIKWKSTD